MMRWIRRHPLAMDTHFQHSLVVTWAVPPAAVEQFMVPGVELETYVDASGARWAFVAAAMVHLDRLRAHGMPARWGGPAQTMVGYRVFARMRNERGQTMRGLRILRSQATSFVTVAGANLTTRYHYRRADARVRADDRQVRFAVESRDGSADLDVTADLGDQALPAGSVFADAAAARRFAGPLPYTFSPDPGGVLVVRSRRAEWTPRPVAVDVRRATFLDRAPFDGYAPALSNAFYLADLDYGWRSGRLYRTGERRGGGRR